MAEIPIKPKHQCQAAQSLETLTARTEDLKQDLRWMEERHEEDIRRLWVRLAALTAAVCAITEGGNILSLIMGVLP